MLLFLDCFQLGQCSMRFLFCSSVPLSIEDANCTYACMLAPSTDETKQLTRRFMYAPFFLLPSAKPCRVRFALPIVFHDGNAFLKKSWKIASCCKNLVKVLLLIIVEKLKIFYFTLQLRHFKFPFRFAME